MTKISLTPDAATMRAIDRQLGRLAVIGRSRALKAAARAAGKVVAKEWKAFLPTSGKWFKPQRDFIEVKVYDLKTAAGVFVKVVNTAPHSHLTELGHDIYGTLIAFPGRGGMVVRTIGDKTQKNGSVSGRFYGKLAAASKRDEASAAIINGLKKAVADATK